MFKNLSFGEQSTCRRLVENLVGDGEHTGYHFLLLFHPFIKGFPILGVTKILNCLTHDVSHNPAFQHREGFLKHLGKTTKCLSPAMFCIHQR